MTPGFGFTRSARILIRGSLVLAAVCGFSFAALALGHPAHAMGVLVGAIIGAVVAVAGFVAAAIADWRGASSNQGTAKARNGRRLSDTQLQTQPTRGCDSDLTRRTMSGGTKTFPHPTQVGDDGRGHQPSQ